MLVIFRWRHLMAITCHYFFHRFLIHLILVITLPGFPIFKIGLVCFVI